LKYFFYVFLAFQVADDFLPEVIKRRNKELQNGFKSWFQYLSAGFNILVYGVGSKKTLLHAFCDYVEQYNYVEADAYYSTVTTRTILQKIESVFSLKLSYIDHSIIHIAKVVAIELEKNGEDVILVINNIDGEGLREISQQIALTELAKCRFIHIVASFDHFNAPCLWSREMLAAFNFLWIRASTMYCYKSEILAGESKLLKLNSSASVYNHTALSLEVIWQALTVNSRMIFAKIIKMYFKENKPVQLLTLCEQARFAFFFYFLKYRNDFLVTNDSVLRQHLVEFLDHRLISKSVELNGNEQITVLVDKKVSLG
uniref:Origin recognition complex subunit 2 n=1 Tax=Syphacia muris TaxID=451379 RepID=A0A0N5AXP0_9BILA